MTTTMTYGNYSFIPVPLMQMSIINQKTQDGTILGRIFQVTLDGSVTPLPTGTAGYLYVDSLQDSLVDALSTDGKRFHIMCDGAEILDVYPRINNITFEPTNDNWVNRADYTVELEFDSPTPTGTPPYITDASEEWTLEFVQDKPYFTSDLSAVSTQFTNNYYALDASPYVLRMTHNLSAVGKSHYYGTGPTGTLSRAAWQEARAYVIDRLGSDNTFLQASGVINLNVNNFQYYDHFRTQNVDELGGSFNITESWVVINPSGSGIPGNILEDFTIDTRKNIDNNLTMVSINGTIEGLSTIDYSVAPTGFSISQSKYNSAQSGWNVIKNRLLPRAQLVSQSITARPLNSGVRTTVLAHNPTKGIISYNYEYDDRPYNCISGALVENISIVDNHPTDVFAALTVLGRAAGPILQDIGTSTPPTRDVNIELIMNIGSGCTVNQLLSNRPTTQVDAILCAFATDLSGNYDQIFLQSDNENWNPKTGAYQRSTRWVFGNCTTSVNTTFC